MIVPVGVVLAVAAAFLTAIQVICIRYGTVGSPSQDALVVVLLVNVATFVPIAGFRYYPAYELTATSLVAFAAAGIIGTLLGRAFYYAGVERIGASRAEPIKASQPLHAALIAVVVLGESLSAGRFAGILLIIGGVAYLSWHATTDTAGESLEWRHLALPFAGAFFYGVEPTVARIALLEGTPVMVGLAIKTIAATLGFVGYLWWRQSLPTVSDLWSVNGRYFLVAGAANSMFLLAYYTALDLSSVGLVIPLIQVSPLFVVVLSFVFLRRLERVGIRLAIASLVVVAGAIATTMF